MQGQGQGRARRGVGVVADPRVHTVSVRLSDAELAILDARRAQVGMQRGEYLRSVLLEAVPPVVPEVNRQAWADLAHLAANINQLAKLGHLARLGHAEAHIEVEEVLALVRGIRARLLGLGV